MIERSHYQEIKFIIEVLWEKSKNDHPEVLLKRNLFQRVDATLNRRYQTWRTYRKI